MKILFYGAGIIGCVYAAKLHEVRADVTLLARGQRFADLEQPGIIINDQLSGAKTKSLVPLKKALHSDDFFDLIIVTVRLDQLDEVLEELKQNIASHSVMFMLNNPDGFDQLARELPGKHILLGFPGVGGTRSGNEINYVNLKQQNTTIGELDGSVSPLLREIKLLFESADFKTAISKNMPAWLKTHAIFITCISAAIMKENGNSIQLGDNRRSVQLMVTSIREGFAALRKQGIPVTPTNIKIIFTIMPQWFCVSYWQKAMRGKMGTLAIAPHAKVAKEEMQLLSKKVLNMVDESGMPVATLQDLLISFIRS